MAHDIRGCFNTVLGYEQLLKEAHNPGYPDTIVESVHRMTRLLDRLVRLMDMGVPMSWLSEVDLNRVIPAVASSVLPAQVELLHDRLPIVLGDPDKVAQAVQNLLVNAVEHGRANRLAVISGIVDISSSLSRVNPVGFSPRDILPEFQDSLLAELDYNLVYKKVRLALRYTQRAGKGCPHPTRTD